MKGSFPQRTQQPVCKGCSLMQFLKFGRVCKFLGIFRTLTTYTTVLVLCRYSNNYQHVYIPFQIIQTINRLQNWVCCRCKQTPLPHHHYTIPVQQGGLEALQLHKSVLEQPRILAVIGFLWSVLTSSTTPQGRHHYRYRYNHPFAVYNVLTGRIQMVEITTPPGRHHHKYRYSYRLQPLPHQQGYSMIPLLQGFKN